MVVWCWLHYQIFLRLPDDPWWIHYALHIVHFFNGGSRHNFGFHRGCGAVRTCTGEVALVVVGWDHARKLSEIFLRNRMEVIWRFPKSHLWEYPILSSKLWMTILTLKPLMTLGSSILRTWSHSVGIAWGEYDIQVLGFWLSFKVGYTPTMPQLLALWWSMNRVAPHSKLNWSITL